MTHSALLQEGFTEQWLNEQWPNVGCTQERLLDPAAAGALRPRPGLSLPQKKFMRQCSSSISGIMENHNIHLAPGLTLNDLAPAPAMWPPSGIFWDQVASTVSTKCPSSSGTTFPCVAREPPGPHSVPGDSLFPPEHRQVSSCGVAAFCAPLVYSLNGI